MRLGLRGPRCVRGETARNEALGVEKLHFKGVGVLTTCIVERRQNVDFESTINTWPESFMYHLALTRPLKLHNKPLMLATEDMACFLVGYICMYVCMRIGLERWLLASASILFAGMIGSVLYVSLTVTCTISPNLHDSCFIRRCVKKIK